MQSPTIIQITANTFTYPAGHPDGPGRGAPFTYAVDDGSGGYLVDTGIGTGSAWIDEHYKPSPFDIFASLNDRRIEKARIKAIICSHMHFDHYGNNRLFPGGPHLRTKSRVGGSPQEEIHNSRLDRIPGRRVP